MRGNDDTWLLLLLGGGALMLASKEKPVWTPGWMWPVPDLITSDGTRYPATVTHEFVPGNFPADYTRGGHPGVDVMYERKGPTDMPAYPPGAKSKEGATIATAKFFAPADTPIIAAQGGTVWSVTPTVNGIFVVIDHGAPWATMYGHLAKCKWPTIVSGTRRELRPVVLPGEAFGEMGAGMNTDPKRGLVDGEHLRHLHFEAWYKGNGANSAVDPQSVMNTWGRSSWQTKL